MSKPSVNTKCVASRYAGDNERIIEFFDKRVQAGGLISFRRNDKDQLVVSLYRLDDNVIVSVPLDRQNQVE